MVKSDVFELPKEEIIDTPDNTAMVLRNAYFRYEKDLPDVLKNINLAICYGEIHSLLVVMEWVKLLIVSSCGINKPYRGKLKNFTKKDTVKYLPQNPQLVFVKDTVYEDLLFITNLHKLPETVIEETINKYDFF